MCRYFKLLIVTLFVLLIFYADSPTMTIGINAVGATSAVLEGSPLVLTCQQESGHPEVDTIQWFRVDSGETWNLSLTDKENTIGMKKETRFQQPAVLQLYESAFINQSGSYGCRGHNSEGWSESNTAHVEITGIETLLSSK